jgi:hypothetical protein
LNLKFKFKLLTGVRRLTVGVVTAVAGGDGCGADGGWGVSACVCVCTCVSVCECVWLECVRVCVARSNIGRAWGARSACVLAWPGVASDACVCSQHRQRQGA